MQNKGVHQEKQHVLTIEAIVGGMYCGKSEELCRRLHRADVADLKITAFVPQLDTRSNGRIVSRRKNASGEFEEYAAYPAHAISHGIELLQFVEAEDPDVIVLDEIQFFNESIFWVVQELKMKSLKKELLLIFSGLDMDFAGKPWTTTALFLGIADDRHTLKAICSICKKPATMTQRLIASTQQVVVGDAAEYEPRCLKHHTANW